MRELQFTHIIYLYKSNGTILIFQTKFYVIFGTSYFGNSFRYNVCILPLQVRSTNYRPMIITLLNLFHL